MEMTVPRPYISVSNGLIKVELWDRCHEVFCATEDGATALMEWLAEKNIKEITCSSTVDFPYEYGGDPIITNIIRRGVK